MANERLHISRDPLYRPLNHASNEIRLLEILPVSFNSSVRSKAGDIEELQCSLKYTSLNHSSNYRALSYAWGQAPWTNSIIVDGSLIPVPENLRNALLQLRTDGIKMIWTDAVCICQSDKLEKSREIRRMGEIYQRASEVVAWLGIEKDQSCSAMRTLKSLSKLALSSGIRNRTDPDWGKMDVIQHQQLEDRFNSTIGPEAAQFLSSDNCIAMENLFGRMWWTRVWVIQEIVLASSAVIKCGAQSFTWVEFCAAHSLLDLLYRFRSTIEDFPIKSGKRIHGCLKASYHLSDIWAFRSKHQLDLEHLFYYTSVDKDLRASDPRDRIYALLGLLEDVQREELVVDYSAECVEVFTQCAESMLKNGAHGLVTFEYCDMQFTSASMNAPSWVPDWTVPHTLILPAQSKKYNANGTYLDPQLDFADVLRGVLSLDGAWFDFVDRILPLPSWESLSDDDRMRSMDTSFCEARATLSATGVDDSNAIWQALSGDWNFTERRRLRKQDILELWKSVSLGQLFTSGLATRFRFLDAAYQALCLSKRGHVCFGSKAARKGDQIFVVPGCRVPMLLRPIPGLESTYKLVSVMWVSSIMDGGFLEQKPLMQRVHLY